jgi:hypothetical protein
MAALCCTKHFYPLNIRLFKGLPPPSPCALLMREEVFYMSIQQNQRFPVARGTVQAGCTPDRQELYSTSRFTLQLIVFQPERSTKITWWCRVRTTHISFGHDACHDKTIFVVTPASSLQLKQKKNRKLATTELFVNIKCRSIDWCIHRIPQRKRI